MNEKHEESDKEPKAAPSKCKCQAEFDAVLAAIEEVKTSIEGIGGDAVMAALNALKISVDGMAAVLNEVHAQTDRIEYVVTGQPPVIPPAESPGEPG